MKLHPRLRDVRILSIFVVSLMLVLVGSVQSVEVANAARAAKHQMVGMDGRTLMAPTTESLQQVAFPGTGELSGIDTGDLGMDDRDADTVLPPLGIGSVIGPDGRVQVTGTTTYPFRANAFLVVKFPSGTGTCTGWFVGPRTLATAGHCVYDTDTNQWATSVQVFPGRNGTSKPYGSVYACYLWSVKGWVTNENTNYDYGAIILPSNKPLGNTVGWYGFFWTSNGASLDEDKVRIYGYPGDKPYGTQWGMQNRIKEVATRKLFHNVDTAGGQSGSAVYETRTDGPYANSIHTNGVYGGSPYNRSTRIVKDVFNNLVNWKNNPNCNP